ncbi:GDSL-like Lipase/Acylhydrolase family protein [Enhydrobacter aerosaccus]|uniref:GDSL-like Lipase/Acylhydrolase family protein n=1 Tax=Enhydrobacter aerosaccus TaxID=225324 RepID=A0A1T4M2W0_9HYPH|nr:GDSL-like Lipase/Acylhydrolase family protein [Enhydrobacter aerosaccus]
MVALLVLELALRAWSIEYLIKWPNFVLGARTVLAQRENSRFQDDPLLGYVPRPNYAVPGISFDSNGFRRTGTVPSPKRPILAVGDSYTYGDEVTDRETWPAQLQQRIGRPVLNAGVSGYGFDQTVLRAEQEAEATHPAVIVVSFIADDIRRTEMRRMWGAEKPYFDLQGDSLVLRNVPVPPRPDPRTTLTFWQRTLGYSYLFDFVLHRLDLLYNWFGDHIRVLPPGRGQEIACRLTEHLQALQSRTGAPILMVAQYDPVVWQDPAFAAEQRRMTLGLLDCARRHDLAVLDTFDALAATAGKDGPRGLYGRWHMNERGNDVIAQLIATALPHKAH